MTLEKGINKIFGGNCVLFVGSGFSLSAKNILGQGIPNAKALSEKLSEECGFGKINDLGKISGYYQRNKGVQALITLLKNEFQVLNVSSSQSYIGQLRWKSIYTTNYDEVVEISIRQAKKQASSVSLDNNPADYPQKSSRVVHLNGYIGNLTQDTLDSSFKLSNRSYEENFKKSKWIEIFENDLYSADAVFFIGFSMGYDLDLRRIISSASIKEKAFFIVGENETRLNLDDLNEFGLPCPMGLDAFVEKVRSQKHNYKEPASDIYTLTSFDEIKVSTNLKKATTKDVIDLLTYGTQNESLISNYTLTEDCKYLIKRSVVTSIYEQILKGDKKFIITSRLGNGKTIALKMLGYYLASKNYKVFRYNENDRSAGNEKKALNDLDYILEKELDAVLIIDDYHLCMELIRTYGVSHVNQILITSTRTNIHEFLFMDIQESIGDYKIHRIDELKMSELRQWDKIFESYALWRDKTTESPIRRIDHLKNKCNSECCPIIIDRINNSELSGRIQQLVNELSQNPEYNKTFIVILLNDLLGLDMNFDDISKFVGAETFNNPAFRKNKSIANLVDIDSNCIKFHSAVLAKHLIKEILPLSATIETLISMVETLDLRQTNKRYKKMFRTIITFRDLQNILKSNEKYSLNEIVRYLDSIKDYVHCNNNMHFWLQYAIVMQVRKDYESAERYYQTSYAIEEGNGNSMKFKIDNHYSKFLIERAINNFDGGVFKSLDKETRNYDVITPYVSDFKKAHSLIVNIQDGDPRKAYLLKVAELYLPFYNKFFDVLESYDRSDFVGCCNDINKKIKLLAHLNDPIVKKKIENVKKDMEHIINQYYCKTNINCTDKLIDS